MDKWQSPIAPGRSWYQTNAGERPVFESLNGSAKFDVVVIGGGYTGLQAAYNLARNGVRVALVEAARIGDGASGRNGGQMGTGQRWSPIDLEKKYGFERSRALFDMAEKAKRHLTGFAAEHDIDIDYQPGQINAAHRPGLENAYRDEAESLAGRYDYPHMLFLDRAETAARIGSDSYFCAIADSGTGHIHPLKLIFGLGRAAKRAGAEIFECTRATAIHRREGRLEVETGSGTLFADRVLIAANADIGNLEPVNAAHVMPIGSYIAATVPLHDFPNVIAGGEAVSDSRFVVRYFRKSKDNRLLFGGREVYLWSSLEDTAQALSRQIAATFPALKDIEISHVWGGNVGITLPRQPFVREVMPGVTAIGGYSGHGVMLSNYCGKLYAEMVAGKATDLDLLAALEIPAFPGGRLMRGPLLMLALTWFALRDRI